MSPPSTGLVRIRLEGLPASVDAAAQALQNTARLTVHTRSAHYPNRRRNREQVRLYLDAIVTEPAAPPEPADKE